MEDLKDRPDLSKRESTPMNPSGGGGDLPSEGQDSNMRPHTPVLPAPQKCPDEKLGFIMCECGLEGISLKGDLYIL